MAVKSLGNVTVTYNGTAITGYLNQASVEAIVAAIDTTVLNSAAGEKISGLGDWNVSVGGLWAKALHDVLNPDCVTPPDTLRDLVVVVGKSGATATYTWDENSFVSGYTWTVEPTGAITWSGTLAVSGVPTMS